MNKTNQSTLVTKLTLNQYPQKNNNQHTQELYPWRNGQMKQSELPKISTSSICRNEKFSELPKISIRCQYQEIFGTSENFHFQKFILREYPGMRNFWNFRKFPYDVSIRKFSELPKISTRNYSTLRVLFSRGIIFLENRRTKDRQTVDGRMTQHAKQIRIRIGFGPQTRAFGHYDALPDQSKNE